MNFVEYVAQTRFRAACRLLHDGDLRISDIAFAAGFQSLSQFNRVFRKIVWQIADTIPSSKAMIREGSVKIRYVEKEKPKKCVVTVFCFCAYSRFVWGSRLTRWIHGRRETLLVGRRGRSRADRNFTFLQHNESNNSRSAQHTRRGVRRLRGMRDLPRTDRARLPDSHACATADKKGRHE